MRKRWFVAIFIVTLSLFASAAAQPCLHAAREVAPVLSPETRALSEKNLEEAEAVHLEKPNAADSIIWLGRRVAYLGRYKDAIRIFSSGITLRPNDARLYRHRGHRYITIRCFDDAIKDFETAARLIKGKSDEIEPDGLPNAKNIPTSTLQSNILYHLGLAYYLKSDFKNALRAYEEARKVSKNADMLVATTHWHYMTLRRLDREREAKRLLARFAKPVEIIENDDYYKLIKLYRGDVMADDLMKGIAGPADTLGNASLGYGLGNWFLYNRNRGSATQIFRQITAGNQWASFGFIAAEVELSRQKHER